MYIPLMRCKKLASVNHIRDMVCPNWFKLNWFETGFKCYCVWLGGGIKRCFVWVVWDRTSQRKCYPTCTSMVEISYGLNYLHYLVAFSSKVWRGKVCEILSCVGWRGKVWEITSHVGRMMYTQVDTWRDGAWWRVSRPFLCPVLQGSIITACCLIQMWQSRVEIKHYSVVFFNCIIAF